MSSMSDPSAADVEKGATLTRVLKDEEEEWVVRFKHLKVMCVKGLLDVIPLLNFVGVMFMALLLYRRYQIWWPALVLFSFAILNFWNYRRMKHGYIQQTLASVDSDLRTTLLASSSSSSKNKPTFQ